MDYSTIINESIEKVYQNGIATKILQHMDRIRNVSDLGQARSWLIRCNQKRKGKAQSRRNRRYRQEIFVS